MKIYGVEGQANIFAMNLLMPESEVRELCKKEKRIDKIAQYFNVEYNVAKERLLWMGYKIKKITCI